MLTVKLEKLKCVSVVENPRLYVLYIRLKVFRVENEIDLFFFIFLLIEMFDPLYGFMSPDHLFKKHSSMMVYVILYIQTGNDLVFFGTRQPFLYLSLRQTHQRAFNSMSFSTSNFFFKTSVVRKSK